MGLFQEFIAKFLPTKDMRILELRKEIKGYKKKIRELNEENNNLKNYSSARNNEQNLSIEFYDENIEDEIIYNLEKAKSEICIAMAWLTSKNIIEVLTELQNKGTNIKIIIDKDKANKKVKLGRKFSILRIINADSPDSIYTNYMHNKYCIIDNKKVIDGSYNWSNNAKYNIEHIIVINNADAAKLYRNNFDKIFNNPRYYDNYGIYENVI